VLIIKRIPRSFSRLRLSRRNKIRKNSALSAKGACSRLLHSTLRRAERRAIFVRSAAINERAPMAGSRSKISGGSFTVR